MFRWPGSPICLQFEVRDSNDALTNAATVHFMWRIGMTGLINRSVVPSIISPGLYRATFTPTYGGTVFWKFVAATPDIIRNGRIRVERGEFDEITSLLSQFV